MTRRWLTIASPTVEAVVNPIVAACKRGFVPDEVAVLSNPSVRDDAESVRPVIETVCESFDGAASVELVGMERETEFDRIAAFFDDRITDDAAVAVDITPGRKFMSAIAFQAGVRYGAEHVFYLLLDSETYYGRVYPDIPEPAVELIDFTEVV